MIFEKEAPFFHSANTCRYICRSDSQMHRPYFIFNWQFRKNSKSRNLFRNQSVSSHECANAMLVHMQCAPSIMRLAENKTPFFACIKSSVKNSTILVEAPESGVQCVLWLTCTFIKLIWFNRKSNLLVQRIHRLPFEFRASE